MKKLLSLILSVTLTMTMFTSCEAVNKALASTYLNLGEKYLTDLDYENAIVYFNKLIEVEPKNVQAYLGAAEAYLGMGDIDSAMDVLEQGIAVVDDPTELEAKLAEILGENEVEDEATTDEPVANEEIVPEAEDGVEIEEVETVVSKEEAIFVTTASYSYSSDGSFKSGYEREYDSNWNEIKYTSFNSDGGIDYWYECEYGSNGNKVEEIHHNADGSINYLGECDADGNFIKEIYYNSDGDINYWYESEFDSNGNMIKLASFYSSGSNYFTEYEYDASGNMLKFVVYYSDGSVFYGRKYVYETNEDKVVKWICYDLNGDMLSHYVSEYDLDGNLIKETTTTTEQSDGANQIIEKEYDSYGNCIKSVISGFTGYVYSYFEYEYLFEGNQIIKETVYDANKTVNRLIDFKYNSTGDLVKEINYDADGNVSFMFYYDNGYDESGKLTSIITSQYDPNGTLLQITYQTRIN